MNEDFQAEDWVALYQAALIELETAKISGRINAAQKAIVARIDKLRTLPGLHPEERHAIEDASRSLKLLEEEEARFDAEAERRAIEHALEKLHSVKASIERLK